MSNIKQIRAFAKEVVKEARKADREARRRYVAEIRAFAKTVVKEAKEADKAAKLVANNIAEEKRLEELLKSFKNIEGKKLLELFSGTHSVKKVAEKYGFQVLSLDLKGADINKSIMDWDYKQLPSGTFDVIWGSPPCHTFSALRRCWVGRKLKQFGDQIVTMDMLEEDMFQNGLPLLRRTEEIIDYFKPKFWFIENPKTGRMKDFVSRPYMDVSYCQYGYEYQKHTRLWTNVSKKQYCGRVCCCKKKHGINLGHPAGTKGTTLKQRYSIPPMLLKELFDVVTPNL